VGTSTILVGVDGHLTRPSMTLAGMDRRPTCAGGSRACKSMILARIEGRPASAEGALASTTASPAHTAVRLAVAPARVAQGACGDARLAGRLFHIAEGVVISNSIGAYSWILLSFRGV
jgi:hypothetical protein